MDTMVDLTGHGYKIKEAIVDNGRQIHLRLEGGNIKNIEVHQAQGEGDKWFIRAEFADGTFVDYFNIVDIVWAK